MPRVALESNAPVVRTISGRRCILVINGHGCTECVFRDAGCCGAFDHTETNNMCHIHAKNAWIALRHASDTSSNFHWEAM